MKISQHFLIKLAIVLICHWLDMQMHTENLFGAQLTEFFFKCFFMRPESRNAYIQNDFHLKDKNKLHTLYVR